MTTDQKRPRVALVTGASSGLGWATAQRLAAGGMTVVCVARSAAVRDRAAELVASGGRASGFPLDVTDTEAVIAAVRQIADEHGGIDILVNNAGGGFAVPIPEEQSTESWSADLAVHLTAPFVLCREVTPYMKRNGWGRIVNISSRAGRTVVTGGSPSYHAGKAGLIGLTRLLASALAPHGITVNAIAPGRVDVGKDDPTSEMVIRSLSNTPMKRVGHASEIAETVAFVVSDGAAFMTGATIDVNGGAFIG